MAASRSTVMERRTVIQSYLNPDRNARKRHVVPKCSCSGPCFQTPTKGHANLHVVPKRSCSGPRFQTPTEGMSTFMSSRSVPVRDLALRPRPKGCRGDIPPTMSSRNAPVRDLDLRPRAKASRGDMIGLQCHPETFLFGTLF